MNKKIYKYQLEVTDIQSIKMHTGAQTLCVQVQNNVPCLWAVVDTDAPVIEEVFYTHGTGHPILDHRATYIDTYQLYNGGLVFHVFVK
jgi:hypothetical protein